MGARLEIKGRGFNSLWVLGFFLLSLFLYFNLSVVCRLIGPLRRYNTSNFFSLKILSWSALGELGLVYSKIQKNYHYFKISAYIKRSLISFEQPAFQLHLGMRSWAAWAKISFSCLSETFCPIEINPNPLLFELISMLKIKHGKKTFSCSCFWYFDDSLFLLFSSNLWNLNLVQSGIVISLMLEVGSYQETVRAWKAQLVLGSVANEQF